MTFLCPKGHQSTDSDYCSECGAAIEAAPAAATLGGMPAVTPAPAAAPVGKELCPSCGEPRSPGARFCEVCRYDFVNKVGSTAAGSQALSAGTGGGLSGFGDLPAGGGLSGFGQASAPAAAPAQALAAAPVAPAGPVSVAAQGGPGASVRWKLTATADRSLMTEEDPKHPFPANDPAREFSLDLRETVVGRRVPPGAPARSDAQIPDQGVSGRHLRLESRDDGTLWAVELGSSNGTLMNGQALDPGVAVELKDGSELTIGMWTRLRVSRV
jgi:hypothetical protein